MEPDENTQTIFIIKTTYHLAPGDPQEGMNDPEFAAQTSESGAREYVSNVIEYMQPGEKVSFTVAAVKF